MCEEIVEGEVLPGPQLHVRADSLAEDRVGHGDGGGQGHGGVGRHVLLDGRTADVLAAANDEVVGPADDRQVAGFDGHDVAEHHPSVGPQQLPVGFVIVPVSSAQGRPLAAGLAAPARRHVASRLVEEPHVHQRDDAAGGAEPSLAIVPEARSGERSCLVRAVELQNRRAAAVLELGGSGVGHDLAARVQDPERRQVARCHLWRLEQHHELSRDRREHRHPMSLDQLQGLLGREPW